MSVWGICRSDANESQNKHAQSWNYVRRYVEWARCKGNYISCRHYQVAPLFLCGLLTADILRNACSRLRIFSKYFPSALEVNCFLFATVTKYIPRQTQNRRKALVHKCEIIISNQSLFTHISFYQEILFFPFPWKGYSSVSLVSRLGAGCQRYRDSSPGWGQEICCSPRHLNSLCGPQNQVSKCIGGGGGFFYGDKAAKAWNWPLTSI
jgi:hypothetical protein